MPPQNILKLVVAMITAESTLTILFLSAIVTIVCAIAFPKTLCRGRTQRALEAIQDIRVGGVKGLLLIMGFIAFVVAGQLWNNRKIEVRQQRKAAAESHGTATVTSKLKLSQTPPSAR